jgi:hypothetical protein
VPAATVMLRAELLTPAARVVATDVELYLRVIILPYFV